MSCHNQSLDSLCNQLGIKVKPLETQDNFVKHAEPVLQVIRDFQDFFSEKNANVLPEHRPYDCGIPTEPGKVIPWGKIYNLTEDETKTMEEKINENLRKGFIRHSSSPAGAPCFFVKKKDGTLRLCVDYHGLNSVTTKNRYPLPLISDLVRTLSRAKVFTALDLRGAYNLVRIKEGDEWKTAFRTRFGHFEYLVVHFGLTNAHAIFQHMMNDIFREHLDKFVIVYLDDIIVFSNSVEEHKEHLRCVFSILRKVKLYCKEEKCQVAVRQLKYLVYVISSTGAPMDTSKTSAIENWPTPRTLHDIQVFLGFAKFYKRFIRNYAEITKPLTTLLKKESVFTWSTTEEKSFLTIKDSFPKLHVLKHPDTTKSFVVETDASDYAIGAVLSQYDGDKQLYPIAFFSRQMLQAERNYEIYSPLK